jgi:UDPglucose 6-dehydrogenase
MLSVVGCGYLGAVHAASMASLGHTVVGIDVDAAKIAALSAGRAPFFEPGFEELLGEQVRSGRLTFSADFAAASGAEVHFLAVGTPQRADGDGADLRFVDAEFEALLPHLADGALVVGKSTVPVGTAARLDGILSERKPTATLAWNPEFLREGYAVQDTLHPDRLVYGTRSGATDRAVGILDETYASILAAETPRLVMDFATAELVKVSANAFLATKISFINAMAEIAEATGADVTQLADAIGHDARIGRRFLNAGLGFGGGCLPKDIRAFAARAEELGVGRAVGFLHEVDEINLRRRDRVVELALQSFGGEVAGRRVTVLGLAFKPDSDDVRDAPALDVARRLRAAGGDVTVTDPEAIETARRVAPDLRYVADVGDALEGAELVVVGTEWKQFRELDPVAAASRVARPVIIDGRNCLDPARWRDAGWTYHGLGRP